MSTPVERQNLLIPFFVLSSLIFAATAWSFYDEFVTRRPWRDYQKEAFKLEVEKANKDIEYYKAKLVEDETKKKLEGLEAELVKAQAEVTSPEHVKTKTELITKRDQLKIAANDEEVKLKILKSELDGIYYRYKHASHEKQDMEAEKRTAEVDHFKIEAEEAGKEMAAKTAEIDAKTKELVAATAQYNTAQGELDQFLNRMTDLSKQLEEIKTPVNDAERRLALAKDRSPDLTQFWLAKLGTVDRCQNCHVEVNRCGFSRPHEPIEALKGGMKPAEVALKYCITPNQIEAYTAVWDGLCDGETSTPGEKAELQCFTPEEWHHVSEKAELYCGKKGIPRRWKAVEEGKTPCPTKEDAKKILEAVDEKKATFDIPLFAQTHPYKAELMGSNHPPDTFGCTTCHGGQGAQTKGISGAKFNHGYDDHYWGKPLLNLTSYRKHQENVAGDEGPGAFLTKQKSFVEASCAKCHADDINLKYAPALSKGRKLMAEIGCYGCHPIDKFNDYRKPGPQLGAVAEKMNAGFLVDWVKYPKSIRPRTRMPNFWPKAVDATGKERIGTDDAETRNREATAIAAYLWKTSGKHENAAAAPGGDSKRGEALVEEVGCRGCHAFEAGSTTRPIAGSMARDFAPNLSDTGSKVDKDWLFRWLKDPQAYWKQSRMPNLRLSDAEAADITAYLMGKTEGKTYAAPAAFADAKQLDTLAADGQKYLQKYGCFGCHEVKGFEDAQRIGADLNDFGNKAVDLLDFGDAITNPREQNWFNWSDLKLRHPRAFGYERVETRMPQFDLTDEEVSLLMVTLKSYQTARVPEGYAAAQDDRRQGVQQGEKVVEFYGCRNCHIINNEGGAIRDRYLGVDDDGNPAEDPEKLSQAPPILNGEGFKTQPPWLHAFLRKPSPLRPWLKVRMPTFPLGGPFTTVASNTPSDSRDKAGEITRFFSASAAKSYPFVFTQAEVPKERLDKAQALFTELKCLQCHLSSKDIPEGRNPADLAPNLGMAKTRLRPDWIVYWLSDPQKFQPGTRMPSFFGETEPGSGKYISPAPDHFNGDAVEQMNALKDYLMNFEPPAAKDKTAMR